MIVYVSEFEWLFGYGIDCYRVGEKENWFYLNYII